MATNKTTVSVYADDELLTALNEFKDSGNHKSLNVAIVAILREKLFGEVSGNVQSTLQSNVQSTLDIEAMVNKAIESRLEAVLSQVEDLRLDLHSIKSNDLITQNLQANLTVAQQRIEALEAIAATTAKLESRISLEIDKIDIRLKAMPDDLEAKLDPIRAQLVNLESRSEATENSKKPMLSVMRAA
jgi:hypothetical protein